MRIYITVYCTSFQHIAAAFGLNSGQTTLNRVPRLLRIARIFRLLKLLRLFRLMRVITSWENQVDCARASTHKCTHAKAHTLRGCALTHTRADTHQADNYKTTIRVSKFVLLIFLMAHGSGCVMVRGSLSSVKIMISESTEAHPNTHTTYTHRWGQQYSK